jgi:hypothetical protein
MSEETVAGAKVTYTIDINQAKAALRDLKGESSAAAKMLEDALGSAVDTTSKKIKKLADDISGGGASRKLQDLALAVEQAGGATKLSGTAFEQTAKRMESLVAAGGKIPPALLPIKNTLDQIREAEAKLAAEDAKLKLGAAMKGDALKNLQAYRKEIKDLAADMNGSKATAELAKMAKAFQDAGGPMGVTSAKLAEMRRQVDSLAAAGGRVPQMLAGLPSGATPSTGIGSAITGQLSQMAGGLAGDLGPAGSIIAGLGPAGLAAAAGLGAVVAVGGSVAHVLADSAREAVSYGSAIADATARNRMGSESYQELAFSAKLVGADAGELTGVMRKLNDTLVNAPEKFEALGLSAMQLRAMSPEDKLRATTIAIQEQGDEAAQDAAALDILGKKSSEVGAVMRAVFEGAPARARELGIVMGDEMVAKLDAVDDAATTLDETWQGLWRNIGAAIVTSGDTVGAVNGIADAVGSLSRLVQRDGGAVASSLAAMFGVSGAGSVLDFVAQRGKAIRDQDFLNYNDGKGSPAQVAALTGQANGGGPGLFSMDNMDEALKHNPDYVKAQKGAQDRIKKRGESEKRVEEQNKKDAAERDEMTGRARRERFDHVMRQINTDGKGGVGGFAGLDQSALKKYIGEFAGTAHALPFLIEQIRRNPPEMMGGNLIQAPDALTVKPGSSANLQNLATLMGPADIARVQAAINASGTNNFGRMKPEIDKASTAAQAFSTILADAAHSAQLLGLNMQSGIGQAIGALTVAAGAGQSLATALDKTKNGGHVNAGGAVLAGVGGVGALLSATSHGNSLQRGASGAVAGASFAQQAGLRTPLAIGAAAAVGAGVGIVRSLIKSGTDKAEAALIHDFGRAGEEAGHQWSKELIKAIEHDTKAMGSHAAELKHFGEIVQEAGGVEAFGVKRATNTLGDMFSTLRRGEIDVKDVKNAFDATFGAVAAGNISSTTGIASSQLKGLVQLAREFKIESPALTEYLKGQSASLVSNLAGSVGGMKELRNAVGSDAGNVAERQTRNQLKDSGLSDEEIEKRVKHAGDVAANAAASGVGIVSQKAATALASSVVATFDELMKEGLSRGDALKEIGPVVQTMQEELVAAGYSGGAAFGELQQTIGIVTDSITGPMVSGIDSMSNSMVNLNNLNLLNQDIVSGMTEQISANIAAMEQQGVTGPAAVAALQPDLQKIWELQQDFGYSVDASTQKLIDEGVAAGTVGEKHRSSADQMIDGMHKVEEAIDRVALAIQNLDGKTGKVTIDVEERHRQTGTSTTGAPPILQPGDPGYDPYSSPYASPPEPLPLNAAGGKFPFRPGGTIGIFGEKEDEYAVPASQAVDFAAFVARTTNMQFPSASDGVSSIRASASATSTTAPRGGSGALSVGDIHVNLGEIHVHGAGDPQATAEAVQEAIVNGVAGKLVATLRETTNGSRF